MTGAERKCAASAIVADDKREEAWMTLVADTTSTGTDRKYAALAIVTDDKREEAWMTLVADTTSTGAERKYAALAIVTDNKRDEAWMTLAKDITLPEAEREDAALAIVAGDKKDETWVALVKDETLSYNTRKNSALAISVEVKKCEALMDLSRDKRLTNSDRRNAILTTASKVSADIVAELYLALARDGDLAFTILKSCKEMEDEKKRNQVLKIIAEAEAVTSENLSELSTNAADSISDPILKEKTLKNLFENRNLAYKLRIKALRKLPEGIKKMYTLIVVKSEEVMFINV